jgi:hypothetical protein
MFEGSCHCEKVKWTFNSPLESVTACNCTLCRRYGALWAYGYLDQGLTVSGPTKSYGRGRKINGYHFCESCGCIAYYLANAKDEQGRFRMAVNLRMISDPQLIASLPIDHFDGLDKFDDLPRDHRNVKDLWF